MTTKPKKSLLNTIDAKLDILLKKLKISQNEGNLTETETTHEQEIAIPSPDLMDSISLNILGSHVKSILGIKAECPFFIYDNEKFKCSYCEEFLALDPLSQQKAFSRKYDSSLGIDFTGIKMRREFRNAKSTLKTHLETHSHLSASAWKKDLKEKALLLTKKSTSGVDFDNPPTVKSKTVIVERTH